MARKTVSFNYDSSRLDGKFEYTVYVMVGGHSTVLLMPADLLLYKCPALSELRTGTNSGAEKFRDNVIKPGKKAIIK
jgi:hypothetical protein